MEQRPLEMTWSSTSHPPLVRPTASKTKQTLAELYTSFMLHSNFSLNAQKPLSKIRKLDIYLQKRKEFSFGQPLTERLKGTSNRYSRCILHLCLSIYLR